MTVNKLDGNIIKDGTSLESSIDINALRRETRWIPAPFVEKIWWDNIMYLCMMDYPVGESAENAQLKPGAYTGLSDQLVLIIGVNKQNVQSFLARCGWNLKELVIRFTDITELDLSKQKNLRRLTLSHNPMLERIEGLSELQKLFLLNISDTTVSRIEISRVLPRMKHFMAGSTPLENADCLDKFPKLERAYLQGTCITQLPTLEKLTLLKSLNLAYSPVETLEGVRFPPQLTYLNLRGTPMKRLPDSIGELEWLNILELSQMKLEHVPRWLSKRKLPFMLENKGQGIYLMDTVIKGVNMGSFSRSSEMIRQWFEGQYQKSKEESSQFPKEENAAPLNEIKVVFLGDGEAGKSHTIARLLQDGKQARDFPGVSTPGIVITNKNYHIDGRDVQVHFWDFGGQEILHSMHRMFLTERTLYVVVLNVREGNQQERARYWLHNLKSFTNSSPVLLVLNKIDMNRNASVNESDLRAMYPALTEIVRMSALDDSWETFQNGFVAALKRQIGAFKTLESPFPPSWSLLKTKLQEMKEPYIRGERYRSLSDSCGVDGNDEDRKVLLNWFNDLGVSFCFSDSIDLEDYVVLRPDWITNAIYIILFNKMEEIKNGLVTRSIIQRMLQSKDNDKVKRTVPDATYRVEEVEYVLNVVRKFRLSFLVDEKTEFMPMLCDANSTPVAEEYARDHNALEFRMHYEYLPNNVLHRLMVDRRRELDRKNVWLTGARFVYDNTGVSAVVKSEGNLLRVMVRSMRYPELAQLYLDKLKDDLEQINTEMGLCVSGMEVVYKSGDTVECFDYEDLMLAQELGDTHVRSKLLKKRIPLADVLMQTDHPADERRNKLVHDIAQACEMLQDNRIFWRENEDNRTGYIRDMLINRGYFVLDQHRGGVSVGGKQAGELDLDIRLEPDAHWAIFEALNVHGGGDSELKYWDAHLGKLLDNYNAVGCPFLFHVSYVKCKKDSFQDVCGRYEYHLRRYSPPEFVVQPKLIKTVKLSRNEYHENQFLRVIESVYDCGGAPMTVYHFFVRIGA